ncbi:XRE family transcriptional regulator [Pilimelia terevasa]|uniref:XRE family transcriptional regulator n=1 Tax=Pilimelia terevasa TaxID=53372 RepID=UPI00166AD396|nr:XRE family transcriptional regulator [Pilimelia terevasa]
MADWINGRGTVEVSAAYLRCLLAPRSGAGRPAVSALAVRLNHLFDAVRRPDGKAFSNDEVAAAVSRRDGVSTSGSYLWYMRRGERDNPKMKVIEGLADFFGVPPGYFFDDEPPAVLLGEVAAFFDVPVCYFHDDEQATTIAEELTQLATLARGRATQTVAKIEHVAMRMGDLSEDSLQTILEIVENVRRLEGLDRPRPGG